MGGLICHRRACIKTKEMPPQAEWRPLYLFESCCGGLTQQQGTLLVEVPVCGIFTCCGDFPGDDTLSIGPYEQNERLLK